MHVSPVLLLLCLVPLAPAILIQPTRLLVVMHLLAVDQTIFRGPSARCRVVCFVMHLLQYTLDDDDDDDDEVHRIHQSAKYVGAKCTGRLMRVKSRVVRRQSRSLLVVYSARPPASSSTRTRIVKVSVTQEYLSRH